MKSSLNLMSERSRKRGQIRGCVRIWSRVFAAVLLVLTLGGFAQWKVCHQQQALRASAEAEYEPIRQLKSEIHRLRKQIALLEKTEHIPLELAKHQPLLSLVGLATQAVVQQGGKVYLQQLEIEREPLTLEPTNSSTDRSTLSFALAGVSVDSTAITRLADSLRKNGPFAAVELSTNKTSRVGKQAKQTFSIECTN